MEFNNYVLAIFYFGYIYFAHLPLQNKATGTNGFAHSPVNARIDIFSFVISN